MSSLTSGEEMFKPVDVTSWIGGYPFRDIPHPEPEVLVRVLEREGCAGAWVGSLDGAFHRDPVQSNRSLVRTLAPFRGNRGGNDGAGVALIPSPIVRPDWPDWEQQLAFAVDEGAESVRVYPAQWGYAGGHPALSELAYACGESGLVLHITMRFEDLRQRHPMDVAGDVTCAAVRSLGRLAGTSCRIVVAGAGREQIEEIHWGLTADEQQRVWYDFHWVWGPPEDHFAHLVRTIGAQRLAHSTWWPLRLSQQRKALLELLPDDVKKAVSDRDFACGRSIMRSLS